MNDIFLAYFDPGAGALLVQGAVAAIASVALFGRRIWTWLRSIASRAMDKNNDDT